MNLKGDTQAYAELLQISCQHDVSMVQHFSRTGDAAAANFLRELSDGQADVDATLELIIPGVMSSDGHIPNQLQDFLLQTFGGYRLASNLDAAATYFRNTGNWQQHLIIGNVNEASAETPNRQTRNESHAPVVFDVSVDVAPAAPAPSAPAAVSGCVRDLASDAAAPSPSHLYTRMLVHATILHDLVRNAVVVCAMNELNASLITTGVRNLVGLWLAMLVSGCLLVTLAALKVQQSMMLNMEPLTRVVTCRYLQMQHRN